MFKVISFYTKFTPYEKEIEKLTESLIRFNIPNHIFPVPNLHSWAKNCQYKANIILESLHKFPDDNIVYTDGDSVFHSYPKLFENLNCDFAYHYLPWRSELLSGTLFFRNNDKIKQLVKEWIDLNSTNSKWDQINLQECFEKRTDLSSIILPTEYCFIYDNRLQKDLLKEPPVVEHFQASRRFRNQV